MYEPVASLKFGVDRHNIYYERVSVDTLFTKSEYSMGTSQTEQYLSILLGFLIFNPLLFPQTPFFGSSLPVLIRLFTFCLLYLGTKA